MIYLCINYYLKDIERSIKEGVQINGLFMIAFGLFMFVFFALKYLELPVEVETKEKKSAEDIDLLPEKEEEKTVTEEE